MNLEVPPATAPHNPFLNTAARADSVSFPFTWSFSFSIIRLEEIERLTLFLFKYFSFKLNSKNGDSENDFTDS